MADTSFLLSTTRGRFLDKEDVPVELWNLWSTYITEIAFFAVRPTEVDKRKKRNTSDFFIDEDTSKQPDDYFLNRDDVFSLSGTGRPILPVTDKFFNRVLTTVEAQRDQIQSSWQRAFNEMVNSLS